MNRRNQPVSLRPDARLRRRQNDRVHRPFIEFLEDRTMLDSGGLPAAIAAGRTLATPSTADTAAPSPRSRDGNATTC